MGSFTDSALHLCMRKYYAADNVMEVDRELIATARRLINGANVHYVETWIYCYEGSALDSARCARYERLLRDFVRFSVTFKTLNHSISFQRRQLAKLKVKSAAINRRIQKFLTSRSD
jgi:hypothetical protein